jgi:hypothetical protein
MKSLEEFNRERAAAYDPLIRGNGIACPSCGGELRDDEPGAILTSCPPQMRVHCPACMFRGLRVA